MDFLRVVRTGAGSGVSVVALVLPAAPPAATPPPFARAPITLAQSGKTFRLAKGRAVALRLSGRWAWTEPRRSSSAVELTRVVFIVDPGYSEWQIAANRRGTATIRSVGTPRCHDCGLSVRRFVVTIRVV